MVKQTAVEWLIEQINPYGLSAHKGEFKIALEMEKQQIQLIYASRCSFISCEGSTAEELTNCNCGKRYYNETFKSK